VRGCLFTLLLAAVVVVLAVFLGLPAVASGLVTAGLTAGGLQSDDTSVTVEAKPPTELLSGHADRVVVHATDATFRGMSIGTLDLALEDVDVLGRTAGSVEGSLDDVTLPPEAGGAHLRTIAVTGNGERLTVATTIPKADVEAMIADAVERKTGVRPTSVALTAPDQLKVKAGGTINGTFAADAGDLIVRIDDGPGAGSQVVVLHGGKDLPMKISKVRVTDAGSLRIDGVLAISLLGG
jgi:hypothetical protein